MHPSSHYLLLLVSSKSLKCTLSVKGFTILQFLLSLGYFNSLSNKSEYPVTVTSLCLQQVLEELQKSNFTLLNQNIQFDENGDFKSGSYSVVFWNQTGDAQEIGFYSFYPSLQFFINNTMIKWYTDGDVSCVFESFHTVYQHFRQYKVIKSSFFVSFFLSNDTFLHKDTLV